MDTLHIHVEYTVVVLFVAWFLSKSITFGHLYSYIVFVYAGCQNFIDSRFKCFIAMGMTIYIYVCKNMERDLETQDWCNSSSIPF